MTVLLSILFWQKIKLRRGKKIVWQILIAITIFSGLVIFYGSFIEPRIIITRHQYLELNPNAKSEITIAFIADLHAGPYKKSGFVKRVALKLLELNPDLIFIGGDNVFGGYKKTDYLTSLFPATKKIPTYAVSGNHEYNIGYIYNFGEFIDKSFEVTEIFEKMGVRYMANEAELIEVNGSKFWLIGLDSVWAGLDNLEHALKFTTADYPKIVLVHNPDIMRAVTKNKYPLDLILTGHTHGGQIRLPLLGPVPPIPTSYGRQYVKGLYKIGDYLLYITSGLGEAGTRARLFNPPEIVLLRIKI